jgi:protease secretion system membrane fusion protein
MAIRNMLTRLQGPKAVPKTLDGDANLPMDTGHPVRVGLWVLGVGFGGFLVWAALAPLDQGVPTSGQVVVTGNRKAVQNLSPGMVEAILVKDGDEVRSGDVLVRLDPTMARSQYETARSQWFVAKATEARLLAESQGQSEILFPDELLKEKDDPRAASAMAVQTQLLRARQSGLQAELGAMKNTLAGLQSSAAGLEATRRAKETQSKLLLEELKGLRELAADGYLPRNRLSEQERLLAQLGGRHFRGSRQPRPHSAEHRRDPNADARATAGVSSGG